MKNFCFTHHCARRCNLSLLAAMMGLIVMFASCKEENPTIEQQNLVADQLTALYTGNIDEFLQHADYASFEMSDSLHVKIMRAVLSDFVKKAENLNGGFDKIVLTGAQMPEDTVTLVFYDLHFKNGEVQSHSQKVVRRNDQWVLRMKEN